MVENKKTFLERLRARQQGRKIEGEKGLALLDVLIGMAIFALVAIIAVTAISQYRARAYESGAVSDARQLGIAMEAAYTDGNVYPAVTDGMDNAAVKALAGLEDVNLTSDNTLGDGTVVNAATGGNPASFVLCVEHKDGAWAEYSSATGGITDKGRSGGC